MVSLYLGFIFFVFCALALDLGVLNRKEHVISTREALGWTAMWVSTALIFCVLTYFMYDRNFMGLGLVEAYRLTGRQAALQFLTGYIVEESLSLDNMVVIAIIFEYFRVPGQYQHRVLFWGILGALIMRGVMIAAGTALLARFEWILYVFGVLLLFTAFRLLRMNDDEIDPEKNILLRLARRFYPVTSELHGHHFFVKVHGKQHITILFLVLLVVESSDVLFAVDSIPAVIAVTRDPFLVFTSNVFAILGLRSLYFALAGMARRFKYLKTSLVVLLAFVGIKMLIERLYHIGPFISFLVIITILATGIVASLVAARREALHSASTTYDH